MNSCTFVCDAGYHLTDFTRCNDGCFSTQLGTCVAYPDDGDVAATVSDACVAGDSFAVQVTIDDLAGVPCCGGDCFDATLCSLMIDTAMLRLPVWNPFNNYDIIGQTYEEKVMGLPDKIAYITVQQGVPLCPSGQVDSSSAYETISLYALDRAEIKMTEQVKYALGMGGNDASAFTLYVQNSTGNFQTYVKLDGVEIRSPNFNASLHLFPVVSAAAVVASCESTYGWSTRACVLLSTCIDGCPNDELYLSNESLSTIPYETFDFNGTGDMLTLRISDNIISTLPVGVFRNLTSLTSLLASNNLRTCDPRPARITITTTCPNNAWLT